MANKITNVLISSTVSINFQYSKKFSIHVLNNYNHIPIVMTVCKESRTRALF